jgi:lipid-A-disaccharide synthase
MKYYIIAGEASGDLHGSNLMKAVKVHDPLAEFRFMGGDLMKAQGGILVKHFKDMAFMGLDALMHLRRVLKNLKDCKNDIKSWNPDVVILIDYAGFNLRIAGFAFKNKIKTFYYISPKVWAWKESRVKKIKKYIDKLFVIFPFEIEYFRKFGIEVEYFGNPLADVINDFNSQKEVLDIFIKKNDLSSKPIIALVAGSRKGEINRLLPEMINAVNGLNDYQFVVAGAPSIPEEVYKKITGKSEIKVVYGQTYNLISNATLAIVTSGTATLETALLKTPEVVVFKTNNITYRIGKLLVDIKFFSLVNLILGREAVRELLQFNLARDIRQEIEKLIHDVEYRKKMLGDFDVLEQMVMRHGVSDGVAQKMVSLLKNKQLI